MIRTVIISVFLVFLLSRTFSVQAQNFNLMPAATSLVNRQSQLAGDGLSIITYQFQSRQSQKEILQFYRTLLGNAGFKQMQPERGKTKYTYYFSKQKDNKIVIINFLRFIDKGTTSYYVTVHQFDPKELAKWPIEKEE